MKTDLNKIEKVLMGYPNMSITNINQNEVHIVWRLAYVTPERLNEVKDKIGAKRVCVTWTPSTISNGIVIFFEL